MDVCKETFIVLKLFLTLWLIIKFIFVSQVLIFDKGFTLPQVLICKLELGLNLSMEEYRMITFLLSFDFFPSTRSKKRLLVSRILSNVLRY